MTNCRAKFRRANLLQEHVLAVSADPALARNNGG
jgi:hypothetical protein